MDALEFLARKSSASMILQKGDIWWAKNVRVLHFRKSFSDDAQIPPTRPQVGLDGKISLGSIMHPSSGGLQEAPRQEKILVPEPYGENLLEVTIKSSGWLSRQRFIPDPHVQDSTTNKRFVALSFC